MRFGVAPDFPTLVVENLHGIIHGPPPGAFGGEGGYQVDLVGGDTTSSRSGLMISITVLGTAEQGEICYRSGAKAGDLLCVSGDLGSAYMGLLLLEREKAVFKANPNAQPDLDGYDYVLERQLKPEPRTDIVKALRNQGVQPTSMIDISDGLSSELMHICKNSEVGCRVYYDKIPINPETTRMATELGIEPMVAALSGGEDYELLFTAPIENHDLLSKIEGVTIIGHIVKAQAGAMLVTPNDSEIPLTAQGWNAISGEE